MDDLFEKTSRAGRNAHTMQGYLCGHYIMIKNNAGVVAARPAARRIPNPSQCDVTDLLMFAGPCDAETCRKDSEVRAAPGKILQLIMEAEHHLGSAMAEYVEAMSFYLSIPLSVRARLEHAEGSALAHRQFSHQAVDWHVDPIFANRREAISILCAVKPKLDEDLGPGELQDVLGSVYRAIFLSFAVYAVNRRVFDSFREMVELQETLELEADHTLEVENRKRIKQFRMSKDQREGIKSKLRNATPETTNQVLARVKRKETEKRFAKMGRQRQKDSKEREMQLASGRWISGTDLNPRKMSLLV